MRITIFSGGTGSEEIQRGLWNMYGDTVQTNIIINGYDDGKSTGIVRKVYNNTILGPSDLRKNHLFSHFLRYGKTSIYDFLNHRFSSTEPYTYVMAYLSTLSSLQISTLTILRECIKGYFSNPNALKYVYDDFSIGNIIYSYLLYTYGVEHACMIICDVLNIPNNVFYQSNMPLELKAVTQSGNTIETEEEIVGYKTANDPIKSVYLIDPSDSTIKIPFFEKNVEKIITESDIILFSCGTQWSSLIPTYITHNFSELINSLPCKKYLLMNIYNDKDVEGYTGADYIMLLQKYLPLNNITIIYGAESEINIPVDILQPYMYLILNNIIKNRKYDGNNLVIQLFMDIYQSYLSYTHYIFDYDYTLYDVKNTILTTMIKTELDKLRHKCSILSANDIKNIDSNYYNLPIISNHGCCLYPGKTPINPNLMLKKEDKWEIISTILSIFKPNSGINIVDRAVSVSIKPVLDRNNIKLTLETILGTKYSIQQTGKTTIEITYPLVGKHIGYTYLAESNKSDSILYISDIDDVKLSIPKFIIDSMNDVYVLLKTINMSALFLPDLIIVAGGINSRMNTSYPKLLTRIGNKRCIDYIRDASLHFVNNIYVFTNTLYASYFNDSFYKTIVCKPDNRQIPHGNLDTFLLGLKQCDRIITNRCILMWGDCVPLDSRIFAEIHLQNNSFLVPCQLERNPYAYVQSKVVPYIDTIGFKKNQPIEAGYHDMSIFQILIDRIKYIIDKEYTYTDESEAHLFDIIPFLRNTPRPATFYRTHYNTYSFNTQDELTYLNHAMNNT